MAALLEDSGDAGHSGALAADPAHRPTAVRLKEELERLAAVREAQNDGEERVAAKRRQRWTRAHEDAVERRRSA